MTRVSTSIAATVEVLGVSLALFHLALTQTAFLESLLVQNFHIGVSIALIALAAGAVSIGLRRQFALALACAGLLAMLSFSGSSTP